MTQAPSLYHCYLSTCASWNLLMGTTVTFKRPDGEIIQGYLAEPEHAAGTAAIVVIQEWWGLVPRCFRDPPQP